MQKGLEAYSKLYLTCLSANPSLHALIIGRMVLTTTSPWFIIELITPKPLKS